VTTVIIKTSAGEVLTLEAQDGLSLMQNAKNANVPGIDADCGGCMVCGTCHVHVDIDWLPRLAAPSEMEAQILECVPEPHPRARLSCQIPVSPALAGLRVTVAARQR
jgi:2Fe-2S ferredoxin